MIAGETKSVCGIVPHRLVLSLCVVTTCKLQYDLNALTQRTLRPVAHRTSAKGN